MNRNCLNFEALLHGQTKTYMYRQAPLSKQKQRQTRTTTKNTQSVGMSKQTDEQLNWTTNN